MTQRSLRIRTPVLDAFLTARRACVILEDGHGEPSRGRTGYPS